MAKNQEQLLNELTAYGYPMMRAMPQRLPEETLADLLRQDDTRLLEAFPVVLHNALTAKREFRWKAHDWRPQHEMKKNDVERLAVMLAVSCLLYKLFSGENNKAHREAFELLSKCKGGREAYRRLSEPFMESKPLEEAGVFLSAERLKENFRNYVVDDNSTKERQQERRQEMELELLLSVLFTQKQKQLLKKRLTGKPMSNTEKSYYYRTVSKRLKAVANEDLHRLARKIVYG